MLSILTETLVACPMSLFHPYLVHKPNFPMQLLQLLKQADLPDRQPMHAQAEGVDLVIIKYDNNISILYGRCLHRGALMADGHIEGDNLNLWCARLGLSYGYRSE